MQSRKTVTASKPPRIYCLAPLADRKAWSEVLVRAVEMQFDSILLINDAAFSIGQTPSDGNGDDDRDAALAEFSAGCAKHGLRLLLDLEIDRFASQHDLKAQHPEHFFPAEDNCSLPDPRFLSLHTNNDRRARLRLDEAGIQLAVDYWKKRLSTLLEMGVAGFRCLGIDHISPGIWQSLIEDAKHHHRDTVFYAWTPGCTPVQLSAIQDCAFDAVFSSDAWWDYRADWFIEEHARLSQIVNCVIAAPEDPCGPRLLRSLHADDSVLLERAYRRALQTAAASGDGMLIAGGFEYGSELGLSDMHKNMHGLHQPLFDLSSDIRNSNQQMMERGAQSSSLTMLSAPDADIALLMRRINMEPVDTASKVKNSNASIVTAPTSALITAINADLHQSHALGIQLLHERAAGWTVTLDQKQIALEDQALMLAPAEVHTLQAQMSKPVQIPLTGGKPAVLRASRVPRIAIEAVTPSVDDGRFPAKRIAGSLIEIEADIFSDGHDHLAASVLWRAADEKDWQELPMQETDNDRWRAVLPLQRVGRHLFAVEAWRDNYDTFRDELDKKTRAGLDVTLEIQEGRQLIEKIIAGQPDDSLHIDALKKLLKQLPAKSKKKGSGDNTTAIALLLSADTATLMRNTDLRDFSTRSAEYKIDVERKAAEFSNWYELFPRSQSGDVDRHGNFDDVIARLPAVREMGFDTLYFPPIHPIGRKNMKGKNNSLTPGPNDPGSPYAIGSADGGHDAVHPQLGTLDDFRRMLAAAKEHGLEIALDFAIQCSPDHPWLAEHPEWFAWRPDGSIRYAENPPKKYEDIVNVDFYASEAIPDLWIALRDVVLMWVREGVRVFRVDNPHTKPLPFWEWMIGDVRSRFPDTLFLAEAFTRPKPMYRLAKVGFSQSYTYFTWRHTKQEFTEYLTELTSEMPSGGPREFFRPHFFVNTPDINPYFLQRSGRPGFLIRAALAATLSGLWGVYSGFELCEAQAVTGKEEYLDSEKYEIRAWDWQRPGNIVNEVTLLNRMRNSNPALQTHLGVRFHYSSSDQILYFSKSTVGDQDDRFGDNVILVAINLDPFATHDASIDLPLSLFGLPDDASLELEDLMSESRFTWHGRQQYIHLDPQQMPFAIWRAKPA